jgi:disulfide bond formation protein DsbB
MNAVNRHSPRFPDFTALRRRAGLGLLALAALLLLPTAGRAAGDPDFNGDGFADRAIGVPREDVGTSDLAGVVQVLYGSGTGLDAAGNQLWQQGSGILPGAAEGSDLFGYALTWDDFNNDSFTDLAIGAPYDNISPYGPCGTVQVIYGSAAGLTASGNQVWTQNSPGIPDTSEAMDYFGGALAAGDFNGDGFADLAIGAFWEDVGTEGNAGALHILYGSASGLSATGTQYFNQNTSGIADTSEVGDMFGYALTAGDVDGDLRDDLAIGAPGESIFGISNAGVAHVLHGSTTGLTTVGAQFWHQNASGVPDTCEEFDQFGYKLLFGDFNGDGFHDLVAAAALEQVGTVDDAGAIHIFYGAPSRLSTAGTHFYSQNTSGVADTSESGDQFGATLAAGDFNGDQRDDLAIGALSETLGDVAQAGVVHVLYGSASGVATAGAQFWHQNITGVTDACEFLDNFGSALGAGDYNGDGRADLAVGVPGEDIAELEAAGALHIFLGSASGLTTAGSQFWTQDSPGVLETAEERDVFGSVL